MKAETTYPAIIGRIIVLKREALGLDQGSLAKVVGVSQSTWSRIENGDSALSMDQLVKVSSALETTPGDLLVEADEAKRRLVAEGVVVHPERPKKTAGGKAIGMAFIGAAALGLLVGKVLSDQVDPKEDA